MDRAKIIEGLKTHSPEVLIIGAGVNGAGTFRDLALNGVDVLLVDKGDFCAGASAASSHMAHGGIRYLENGEFRLVREAVRERNRMIENAPHLVRPLPTVVPMFKLFSGLLNAPLKFLNLLNKPSERGAVVIKIGLIFYDSFTKAQKTVPPHKFENRQRSLEKYPALSQDIKYTATYFDGSILSPERYVVELVVDGEAEGDHANALNYVAVEKIVDGAVQLRDQLTGELLVTKPKLVINATGPWIDVTNQGFGLNHRYIGGTKGSHIIVDNPTLRTAIGKNEFFFENKDGRIVLIFPFYDKVIIGTSDLPIESPDNISITEPEIDYFITLVNRVFPSISITKEQIVFTFSGVRPLEAMKAKTAGQITRDHSIKEDEVDGVKIISLVGGKWTSYRAFSEQVADLCLGVLGRSRKKETSNLPLGGGRDYPVVGLAQVEFIKKIASKSDPKKFASKLLFDRYGTRAKEVADFLELGSPKTLRHCDQITDREIEFLVRTEKAVHIEDILIRRTNLAWLGNYQLELIEEIADAMGKTLGWSAETKKEEVERTVRILANDHKVTV